MLNPGPADLVETIHIMPAFSNVQVISSPPFSLRGSANFFTETADVTPLFTEPAGPTNQIITRDQQINIKVDWTATGWTCMLMNNHQYVCKIFLECMGPLEAVPGEVTAIVNHIPVFTNNYSTLIATPPNLPAGLYKVVFTLSLRQTSPALSIPTGAFVELGYIQVLEDF